MLNQKAREHYDPSVCTSLSKLLVTLSHGYQLKTVNFSRLLKS